jgi:hypothetical protein
MVAVRMMEVSVHQVVDMVAVGNPLVAAIRPMAMIRLMPPACVGGRASGRISRSDRQNVVIDMVAMMVMQVAIMQVICVAVVRNSNVAATGTMLMSVAFVNRAFWFCHSSLLSCNVSYPVPIGLYF